MDLMGAVRCIASTNEMRCGASSLRANGLSFLRQERNGELMECSVIAICEICVWNMVLMLNSPY